MTHQKEIQNAIEWIEDLRDSWNDEANIKYCNMAIKALERDLILDKIRAEIEQHRRKTESIDPYDLVGDCLDILDKYTEGSEE